MKTFPNKTINELFGIEGQYVWSDDIDVIPEDAEYTVGVWKQGSGIYNSFYGKKHTEETKEKMRKVDRSYMKTDAYRQKMSESIKRWHESKRKD